MYLILESEQNLLCYNFDKGETQMFSRLVPIEAVANDFVKGKVKIWLEYR
jgi:hypothetical protein